MRVILTILVCATTLLVGCGGSASDSNTVPPPKNIAPNPAPNPLENKLNLSALDQQNSLYSSDLGYTTALERVFNLKNDKLLVLGETSSVEEPGNKEGFYAITDPNGQTYQFEQSTEGFVDACVFDSGEYILGRFIQEGDDIFSVQLERYDETGVQLKSAPMQALSMDVKYDIPLTKTLGFSNLLLSSRQMTLLATQNTLKPVSRGGALIMLSSPAMMKTYMLVIIMADEKLQNMTPIYN